MEKERHPVTGDDYATITICGLCTCGNENGLLTPSRDSTLAVFDTTALKHSGKTNVATTNNDTLFPESHYVEDVETKRSVRGSKQGQQANEIPH